MHFHWTAWATLAALLTYSWMIANVGRARGRYKVPAPQMDGPPEFLRAQRVLGNTAEQMLLFLPALWLCAIFLGDRWAAAGGALWVLGRILYATGYYQDAARRFPGFLLTMIASSALLCGAVAGLLLAA